MATYPVEFHRRLEQKWESRIEQILSPMIARRYAPAKITLTRIHTPLQLIVVRQVHWAGAKG